ncbi:hypothetical protein [Parapusillimonas granuli]|uniref:Uncharacterized protein n=1 Tax=Parapusillimonas granuli TaxID=380911 RepID=A0A853FY88_9BURK|nr:hypothetical protein [Parapusillimonas granuli]MBB5215485.1 hypothetical protein [Parapusillimonas granuli]MEB2400322.1 hypothetical protein [Alcaligenaceae bacterium]NYT49848.1 hypothetical protein [Parapusillimonas granuli]
MRFLFIVVLLANVAVLGFGQGFFGPPPSERGREPRMLSERNQHAIQLGAPESKVSGQSPSAS